MPIYNITGVMGTDFVQIPFLSGIDTFTYDGTQKSITLENLNAAKVKITNGSATNAGEYTLVMSLKNPGKQRWVDKTVENKTINWKINKAVATISLSKDSISLDKDKTADTVTVTTNSDGQISVSFDDSNLATAAVNNKLVTIISEGSSGQTNINFNIPATTNYTAISATIPLSCTFATIYGAQWDGTSTTSWTRTDAAQNFSDPVPYVSGASSYSSPFDNLMPWSGMTVSSRTGGSMVAIPKFYYKLTQNGSSIKIQIADGPMDGYSVSPAHLRRGSETADRDVVYVGRYHCCTSDYKSTTGVKPKVNITRSTARTGIHNLGTNIWQTDFAMRFTLWLLYIVEFADWNSQAKIGQGCSQTSSSSSAVFNMGYTDSMPYHTGTTQTSRTSYGGTQYRNIEGLWDNCYDWMDGCYYNNSGLNLILNPSSFSDSSGGTLAGKPSDGFPTKFTVTSNGGFPMFYASEANNGSDSTYSCDSWYFNASVPCLFVGGYYNQGLGRGLFFVDYFTASGTNASIGCRLMELP